MIVCATHKDEDGAILLLALIFVLILSLSIYGLVTFGGIGIKNTVNLKGQQSLEYAADGATEASIQAVRYSNYAWNYPLGNLQLVDCLPDGAIFAAPSTTPSLTINNTPITVDCIPGPPSPASHVTRVVTFYACPQAVSPCSAANSVVFATVDFEDVTPTGSDQCNNTNIMTCGMGEIITSWVVQTAND
jgi:hypothetical protein